MLFFHIAPDSSCMLTGKLTHLVWRKIGNVFYLHLFLNDLLEYKPKITLKIDFWTHAITNFVMAVSQQHSDASFLDCPL